MAVKIRLRRMGQKKAPFYRIVVADSRSPRDGRCIGSRRAPLLPNEPLHLSFKPPGEGVFWNFFIGRQPAQPQIFRFGHRLVEVRIRDLHVRLHLLALQ